ncbi:MAG: rhomboid family intramembrane serine protease [Hyphomicrobiaceae bacterium]|nr:rhomboid family intramembrane serine protease [Hyphomicrobiaceae bacterium]
MQSREPIFNAPPVIAWLLGLLVLVHVAMSQLSDAHWSDVMETLALIPARYGTGRALYGQGWVGLTSLVTHQLVHGDVTHLVLNSAWLLAFGSAVASRIGAWRFLAFAVLSGIAGGLAFIALHLGDNTLMVGASGALAGLMGGAFRFLFSAFDDGGPAAFRGDPRLIRRMSLAEVLRDRRGALAIGFWVVLNFATALIAPLLTSAGGIAWEAHLGGFAFGLVTFGLFDPPRPQMRAALH